MPKTYLHKGSEKRGRLVSAPAYQTRSAKIQLIDAITNLIDEGIRKSRYETYDEWQTAVSKLLTEHEYPNEDVCADASEDDSNDPMSRTIPRQPRKDAEGS